MTTLSLQKDRCGLYCINNRDIDIYVPKVIALDDNGHGAFLELLAITPLEVIWNIPHPVILLLSSFDLKLANLLTTTRPMIDSSVRGSEAIAKLPDYPSICVWARQDAGTVLITDRLNAHELGGMTSEYRVGGLSIKTS